MFIMIDGELLNTEAIAVVTPEDEGPGCIVQFKDGGSRFYGNASPETFAQAIINGGLVYYVGGHPDEQD